ncbi:hypothetical protein KAR91_18900 [Candidatus Pacearchaeota archaeon]|nr:hypothetical protein [Candidatus Pacearchaeota archaeon]
MKYSKIRNICILIFIIFTLQSCVVLPKTVEDESNCELYTKQITLEMKAIPDFTYISGCHDEICLLLLFAPVTVSAVVSGSIMLAGNTIHWIEKEGRCDEDFIAENVAKTSEEIADSGGYVTDNSDEIIEWMENLPTKEDQGQSTNDNQSQTSSY